MSEKIKHSLFKLLLKYFTLIFIVFFLQIVPLVGIIAMMFGGMLWLSVILNIMLIHVAITAFYPGSNRFRLLIPLTVYAVWQVGIAVTRATVIERVHVYEASNRLPKPVPLETDIVFEDYDWQFINDVALLSPRRRIFNKQYLLVLQEVPSSQSSSKFDCRNSARLRGADYSFGPVERKGISTSYCIDSTKSTISKSSVHIIQNKARKYFSLEGDFNVSFAVFVFDGSGQQRKIGDFRSGTLEFPSFSTFFTAGCFPNLGSNGFICGTSFYPFSNSIYFGADREKQLSDTIATRAKAFVQMLDGESAP